MNKRMRRRWSERTRVLLILELAVVLPAAALSIASVWNLHHIQRDKAVEAAIQRDFLHVLKIAEKRLNVAAFKMVDEARAEFPCSTDPVPQKLEEVLQRNPQFDHAFFYEPKVGFVIRSQPDKMSDPDFAAQSKEIATWLGWLKSEGPMMAQKLRESEIKENMPYVFYPNVPGPNQKYSYQSFAIMVLPKWPGERPALGGLVFSGEFLKDKFFPAILDSFLAEDKGGKSNNPAVMMIRVRKESKALATSALWDGGMPEMERNTESGSAFPYLILAIKFRGTTVEALSDQFLRNSFLLIGGISVFLAFGIWLTYHNVSREMDLARQKSDFVANVSHELRTPLSLIRLYAETLEMGRLTNPEKPKEYYQIIRKESERLTGLINNILDFSRIESGRKEYDFRETNLAELVRDTLEAYRYQIEQNGFTFQSNIAENLPPIRIDREAIARSLLNLINNAVKYSAQDKYLGVNLSRQNGAVQIEVIDHGIGIPRTEQSRIFEKFYRSGDPLVHNTKGSGLGLALVRHIVQAHGGRVSVESTPGKGSKFTIALPIQPGNLATQPG